MNRGTNLKCEDCKSRDKGIFCELSHLELSGVSKHKVTNTYKKGQTIFFQGNPPYGLYCINEGNVKVTKVGNDGKESIVRVATNGDVLGHRSLFTDQYYSATATVLEDSTICFIDKKYILKTLEEHPSVSFNLISKLGKEMGAAENKVASFHQKNVRERLAELLLLLKGSHGEEVEPGRWKLDIKLTREEMASMIGTANETLIRFLSELKEEGIVAQEGKTLFVVDEEKLVEFANLVY